MASIVLAGGGSAGHVNPLLATARELADRDPAVRLTALGVADGLEADLVPAAGLDLALIPKVPMPRRPNAAALRFPIAFRAALARVRELLAERRADAVVGFGGYVSTPAYLAARAAGIPFLIHEQNARPGYANRLGARAAAVVALTFDSTPLRAARGRTVVTGLPLRADILDLARRRRAGDGRWARDQAAAALGLDPACPTMLVTGGSLGAASLNDAVGALAAPLTGKGLQILHLTGAGKAAPIRAEGYHQREYLTDMHLAYAASDFVVCRAGAGTVAELTALALPAIYVPLPIGNGEQRRNAAGVLAAGGGTLIEDRDLTADTLAARIDPWLADPDALRAAGQAALSVGTIDGARALADEIEGTL